MKIYSKVTISPFQGQIEKNTQICFFFCILILYPSKLKPYRYLFWYKRSWKIPKTDFIALSPFMVRISKNPFSSVIHFIIEMHFQNFSPLGPAVWSDVPCLWHPYVSNRTKLLSKINSESTRVQKITFSKLSKVRFGAKSFIFTKDF